MNKIIINLNTCQSPSQIHDEFYEKLDLPDYYGRNLDALHDCLGDISEDTVLAVYEPSQPGKIVSYLNRLHSCLKDSEQENPHLCVVYSNIYTQLLHEEG